MEANQPLNKAALDQMHKDPANWRLGVFYYNPSDPRRLPPKRYGWGWTTNFANVRSIAMMVVLFGVVFGVVFAAKALTE